MATNDRSWISTIDSRATAPIYNSTRLSTNQPRSLKNRVCLSMNRNSRYDPVFLSMRPDVLSTNRTSAEYMCKSMTWNKTLWTASDIDQTRTHIILWPKQLFFNNSAELFNMMTSSNGNIFRVTGLLCGEFTSHRWIPITKARDAELWCFIWSAPKSTVEKHRDASDFRRHRAHYDVL